MSANKTMPTEEAVDTYVARLDDAGQRADTVQLIAIMARASSEPPAMWGPSIIGFGSYHYRYDSGREGDACRIGFAPRKGNLVLYLTPYTQSFDDALTRLGKHKRGKGCLYIKRLSDVDMAVLEEIVGLSLRENAARHPG